MATANIKYNSEIEIVEQDGKKFIDKRLRLGLKDRNLVEELRQMITLQRHAFEKIHVPVSELINIEVIPTEPGEFTIKIREVFAGLDFMDVVTDENYSMYLDRLLADIFKPLLTSTKNDNLPAGIDPVLRNFVYDTHKGEFCYVDFMPPKVFYKGRYTQEIPEITDQNFYEVRVAGHNNRAGLVYNLYINLVREFPAQLGLTSARLEQFLTSCGEGNLYEAIKTSPLYRAHTPSEVKAVADNISDWHGHNYYLLREIANWLNSHKPELTEIKRSIYKATSQERDPESLDYGRISEAQFLETKRLIQAGLEQCA